MSIVNKKGQLCKLNCVLAQYWQITFEVLQKSSTSHQLWHLQEVLRQEIFGI